MIKLKHLTPFPAVVEEEVFPGGDF